MQLRVDPLAAIINHWADGGLSSGRSACLTEPCNFFQNHTQSIERCGMWGCGLVEVGWDWTCWSWRSSPVVMIRCALIRVQFRLFGKENLGAELVKLSLK